MSTSTAAGREGSAAQRWRRLVTGRIEELERLAPELGPVAGAFWDRRADRYAAGMKHARTERDPFLRRLRRLTGPASTVLDVGAGTGRFALALAPGVAHVSAVDPSAGMLAVLARDAEQAGVTNVATLQGAWEQVETEPADVAFAAFVLPIVADAERFVTKLDGAARERALLYLGAYSADAVLDPLWRHFHGAPRAPGASYLDALAVLRELGISPRVRVVEIVNHRRYATLEEAVGHYRDALALPDTDAIRTELQALLASWLMGRRGAWRAPLRAVPAAIVEWTPGRDWPGKPA